MGDEDGAADPRSPVRRVFARVNLQSSWRAELQGQSRRVIILSGGAEHLSLHVSLSAEVTDGGRIDTRGRDFGMSGPRRGIWHRWHGPPLPEDPEEADRLMIEDHRIDRHDIEDRINQMLGRDPRLHHPPRLAWGHLIAALADAGIHVNERDLIETPLTVELAPEVQAELQQL